MKQSLKKFTLVVVGMFLAVFAFAQVTTSALGGRVVEDNGEPVIGVAVIATHTPSGTRYGTVTNNNGYYSLTGMRTGGPYTVEVTGLGYQTIQYTDVTLVLSEVYNLNVTIKPSSDFLKEAIVVASALSRFSTEKTGAATNISSREITDLPTVSRSITDVTKLSPYGGNGMTFAGADGRTANFTVDGANFNNNFGLSSNLPGGGNPISIDAIEEMQVVISPFDVRQTNFVGGGVNAITKSGTNTLKGTAYMYHRNENMRGNAVAGQEIAGARAKDRKTTYGFTLGGPIVKNKLFFFANFEYTQVPTIVNRWRATPAKSATPNEFGIREGVKDANNYMSRTSLEDMEAVSKFVMDKYDYNTGSWTDFPANESNMKVLARIDWNISDKHKLALRYNYTLNQGWNPTNASSMDGGSRSPYSRLSEYSMAFANTMYSMDNIVHTASLNLNSRLTDKLSNEFLATFSKLDDIRGTNSAEFPHIDIRDGNTDVVTPYMSLGHELFTWNNGVHNTVATVKDELTFYEGDHKIIAGLSYEYQMADNAYMRNGTGYYRYMSLDDFMKGAAPEVVCLTYGYDGEQNPAARVRYSKAGIYAQDDWSINENFKLTYGLRLDGLIFNNKDLMTNNEVLGLDYNGRSIDTGKWPTSKLTVSPRIGFSWDILGDKSLKVRGGTGFFSGRLPLVFFTNMPTNSGMVQYQAQITSSKKKLNGDPANMNDFAGGLAVDENGHATIDALLKKIISLGYGPETIDPKDGTAASTFAAVDPKFKMPQVWKTSLAVDYSFDTSFPFSISVEGIFNKTINAVCISDWSIKPVAGFARFSGVDNRPIYPSDAKYTYTNKSGKVVGMPNAYVLTNTNQGYGYIGSVTINARPTKNLSFMAAYTHSASYELTGMPGSDASSAFTYVPGYNGPNNATLHASQYVTPDRAVASATYHDKCNNNFSLIYEAWRGGYNYSYMLANDMNGDGYNYDVIYIPNNADELQFVSADDKARFWNYVENDPYLSKNKGKYAEAYSVYSPWVHRLDFHYSHDFKVKIGNTTNTLQLNFDIANLLNLFNSSWGVSKVMNADLNSGRILNYKGVDGEGRATFSTPDGVQPNMQVWTPNYSLGQCWSAQIGIKYLFN